MSRIDLERTHLTIQSVPEPYVDFRTIQYFVLKGMPFQNIAINNTFSSVVESRNAYVLNSIVPKANSGKYDWFIFMDRDQWPTQDTDEFLDDIEGYHIVGAAYDVGSKKTWANPDSMHMGTVRVHAEVFQKMVAPWFAFRYSADGTRITMCECDYFKIKAQELGFSVTRRGWTEHNSEHSWKKMH